MPINLKKLHIFFIFDFIIDIGSIYIFFVKVGSLVQVLGQVDVLNDEPVINAHIVKVNDILLAVYEKSVSLFVCSLTRPKRLTLIS